MMKKLLVLALVLGMASLASAGLKFVVPGVEANADGSYTVEVSTIFDVVLTNDAPFSGAPGMGGVSADLTNATVEGPATIVSDNIPGDWTIEEYGYDPQPIWYWLITNTVPGVGETLHGDLLSIKLHCAGEGDVVVELWNTDFDQTLASVTIHQTPEPASMLLLGLGGLFLRRRK